MKEKENTFSRRKFVGSLAGLGAGASLTRESFSQEKQQIDIKTSKPNGLNIIVIICDTFRWDFLHCNGNDRIKTPNLDALAGEGVNFTNCYADGLATIPARRVMHTGKSILAERNRWHALNKSYIAFPMRKRSQMPPDDDITFAEILGVAGFTTGFIVDTFHHFKPDMNFHYGFDSWSWIRGQEADPYICAPRNSVDPEDYSPKHLLNDDYRENIIRYVLNTSDRKSEDDYFCAKTCSTAVDWLEKVKGNDGPFMLFIDMFDPHEPWDAPPRFKKMYRDKYPLERYIFGYGVDSDDVREEDIPVLIDLYSAEVTFSDYCIGKLLDEVKRLGFWDNTIIVFSTDHGTHLGEEGCVQKKAYLLNSCYAHVPLIIRHPDREYSGKIADGLTSHADFLPTFLSMLGVETNIKFDGMNMWDLATGSKKKIHEYVLTGAGNFGSIHNHKWHYFQNIWGNNPGHGPALYDLKEDFTEKINIINKHPDVVAVLKKVMEKTFKVSLD